MSFASMLQNEQPPKASFKKAFAQGLAGVFLVLVIFVILVSLSGPSALEEMETRLASQAVIIKRAFEYPPLDQVTEVGEAHVYARGETPPAHETPPQASTAPAPAPVMTGAPLPPAPVEGLTEVSDYGPLPCRGPDGLTPFVAYKKPFATQSATPVIALAVIGYGLSEENSNAALAALPPGVSLILSPYAANPSSWQIRAREKGHETWIQLPLQTMRYPMDDPGPRALLARAGLQQNQDALNWVLSRATGYAGVAAVSDNAFQNATQMLQALLKNAFGRGLGFFEIDPSSDPLIETMAIHEKAPYVRNMFYLDGISLKTVEKAARDKGYAIAVLRPEPNVLKSVSTWLGTLQAKNIQLAPISAVASALSPAQEAPAAAPAVAAEPTQGQPAAQDVGHDDAGH